MSKENYHHGDLHQALLEAAKIMLTENGVDALSLRKLAERVGVSRTAAYHHFADKHALLCDIAASGFHLWQEQMNQIQATSYASKKAQYRDFVYRYLAFATQNPHLYNLMFGQVVWQEQQATEALKAAAFPTFDNQVSVVKQWQQQALLPKSHSPLRLSQVIWGTLHGIAKLTIDGIYTEQSSIDEMCECAIEMMLQQAVD
ncbi:TetR/AcrR family transcriptional regulator [Thalassotalea marina]|uniref:TetR family transcriptional regulator n=1 Tax=Thalassotalea marina TaxID=1673741 RepID=A0A919BC39_9GAMM|nr:TetR/AcrR family transcriptional regulator [Thalassotalea marina]GHF81506.1 TetR family transcriptional regulator [Thalassotalea marina]